MENNTNSERVTRPSEFFLGFPDCPNFSAMCIEENGTRYIRFSVEMARSHVMSKHEVYAFTNWLIWANSWVSDII